MISQICIAASAVRNSHGNDFAETVAASPGKVIERNVFFLSFFGFFDRSAVVLYGSGRDFFEKTLKKVLTTLRNWGNYEATGNTKHYIY